MGRPELPHSRRVPGVDVGVTLGRSVGSGRRERDDHGPGDGEVARWMWDAMA
jgi:hypothetical protein